MIKLVIVEDESTIRECLEYLFPWKDLDIEVVASFGNGLDAYKFITSREADILLTDICLPRISGLELLAMLRKENINIPAVVLTAYRQFEYAQKAVKLRVHDFLLKPIKHEELMAAMLQIRDELSTESVHQDNSPANDGSYHEKIIANAKRYISHHIAEATLETAALSVNLSPAYFSRLFHQVTQETFIEYLTSCRMKKAAELLDDITKKTYEVALLVGYDNAQNFTRAFKQFFNMTPREYRNRLSEGAFEK